VAILQRGDTLAFIPHAVKPVPWPLPAAAELPFARFGGLFVEEAVMYLKLIAAVLSLAFVAGCNTMAGAGKDVQSVGESLENSAQKHK